MPSTNNKDNKRYNPIQYYNPGGLPLQQKLKDRQNEMERQRAELEALSALFGEPGEEVTSKQSYNIFAGGSGDGAASVSTPPTMPDYLNEARVGRYGNKTRIDRLNAILGQGERYLEFNKRFYDQFYGPNSFERDLAAYRSINPNAQFNNVQSPSVIANYQPTTTEVSNTAEKVNKSDTLNVVNKQTNDKVNTLPKITNKSEEDNNDWLSILAQAGIVGGTIGAGWGFSKYVLPPLVRKISGKSTNPSISQSTSSKHTVTTSTTPTLTPTPVANTPNATNLPNNVASAATTNVTPTITPATTSNTNVTTPAPAPTATLTPTSTSTPTSNTIVNNTTTSLPPSSSPSVQKNNLDIKYNEKSLYNLDYSESSELMNKFYESLRNTLPENEVDQFLKDLGKMRSFDEDPDKLPGEIKNFIAKYQDKLKGKIPGLKIGGLAGLMLLGGAAGAYAAGSNNNEENESSGSINYNRINKAIADFVDIIDMYGDVSSRFPGATSNALRTARTVSSTLKGGVSAGLRTASRFNPVTGGVLMATSPITAGDATVTGAKARQAQWNKMQAEKAAMDRYRMRQMGALPPIAANSAQAQRFLKDKMMQQRYISQPDATRYR